MVCPHYSKKNGKSFCRIYGSIDATVEKIERECQGQNYHTCFKEANDFSIRDAKRHIESTGSSIPHSLYLRFSNQLQGYFDPIGQRELP